MTGLTALWRRTIGDQFDASSSSPNSDDVPSVVAQIGPGVEDLKRQKKYANQENE